jgi:predicted chitinase
MPAAVLNYNAAHELVTQETYYNCGPGSCQLVLDARGITVSESELSAVLGTTVNGTPSIDNIAKGLNHYDGASQYASMWMANDPPTADEVNLMRERIFRTIAWGRGCVANVVVPPSNYPKAVPKSDPNLPGAAGQSPGYGGGIVYHYISVLGADSSDDTVMIVDPGFQPSTYWVTVTQLASMVTPHGIVWASAAPVLAAHKEDPKAPAQEPASRATADLLSAAMGGSLPVQRYAELLPAVLESLANCDCTNENRVAEWMAQIGHESVGLQYMEEIADGSAYEGRADLGNTQPGDGPRYKGRGPIQITGRSNYTQVSEWAHSKGLVPTPTFFVDQPEQLGTDRYAFRGTEWYWTVARPNINAMADAGDHEGVCRAINGGLNGFDDRVARFSNARPIAGSFLPVNQPAAPPTAPAPAAPQGIPTIIGRNGPKPHTAYSVDDKVSHTAHEVTMWLSGRSLRDGLQDVIATPARLDTTLGHAINAASLGRVNYEILTRIAAKLGVDITDIA